MEHMLKLGDKGQQVKMMQQWLNNHGFKAGKEDGIFGEKTRDAVIEFQGRKNIVTDGIIGSQTQIRMEREDKGEETKNI
ncbi:MAG: peptidoglycan-binding domain-containing protein [Methanobacterium sp.]